PATVARAIEWRVTRVSYGECASFAQRAQVSRSEPQASEDHRGGERSPSGGSSELVVAIRGEPHLGWRAYCDLFASLVRRVRAKRVVLLGAYVADVVYSRPVDVSGFASDAGRLPALRRAASGDGGATARAGV